MNLLSSKAELEIYRFIQGKKILIVDPVVGVRSIVISILKDLGSRPSDISQVADYESASELIPKVKPHIIICDYHLNGGSGLDLIRQRNELMVGDKNLFSVIISADAKETSIIEAAENDVDCYIIKPFTIKSFQEYLVRIILNKQHPNSYHSEINQGKIFFAKKDFIQAEKSFNDAILHHEKPTLAYYYLGRISLLKNNVKEAVASFESGLKCNPHHYLCLTGLFDLYWSQDNKVEAFRIAKEILAQFQVCPKRLEQIIFLAVETFHFDEIHPLYQLYLKVDHRGASLTRTMISSLMVSGIHFIQEKEIEKGVDHFKKAMTSSGRSMQIFQEIISVLLKFKLHHEAYLFLSEVPAEAKVSEQFKILNFLILDRTEKPIDVIAHGMKLLSENVADPMIYEVLVRRNREAGKVAQAEHLCIEAAKRWPEREQNQLNDAPSIKKTTDTF